jgi:hypothetical protein
MYILCKFHFYELGLCNSFLNQLGFSKIMKKYDKITSRNASKAYLEMVDKSDLGSSDVVSYEPFSVCHVRVFATGYH